MDTIRNRDDLDGVMDCVMQGICCYFSSSCYMFFFTVFLFPLYFFCIYFPHIEFTLGSAHLP